MMTQSYDNPWFKYFRPQSSSPCVECDVMKEPPYRSQFKELYQLHSSVQKSEFLDNLFSFMKKKGMPVYRLPVMAKQPLDLFRLYTLVVERGGLVEVIRTKLWKDIAIGLDLPTSMTSSAFTLRSQYLKYLYPFECHSLGLSNTTMLQEAVDGNRREVFQSTNKERLESGTRDSSSLKRKRQGDDADEFFNLDKENRLPQISNHPTVAPVPNSGVNLDHNPSGGILLDYSNDNTSNRLKMARLDEGCKRDDGHPPTKRRVSPFAPPVRGEYQSPKENFLLNHDDAAQQKHCCDPGLKQPSGYAPSSGHRIWQPTPQRYCREPSLPGHTQISMQQTDESVKSIAVTVEVNGVTYMGFLQPVTAYSRVITTT